MQRISFCETEVINEMRVKGVMLEPKALWVGAERVLIVPNVVLIGLGKGQDVLSNLYNCIRSLSIRT